MKTPATKKTSARKPRASSTHVDRYPNVLVIHRGDPNAPEMTVPLAGCADADTLVDVVFKGLRAQGRSLRVRNLDATGQPVKTHE